MYHSRLHIRPDIIHRYGSLLRWSLLLVVFGLSACATPPLTSDFDNPDWQVSGKIGIRETGSSTTSGIFQWSQQADAFAIYVYSGFGQLQFTLIGDHRYARIERADGYIESAPSAQTLLQSLTGWSFPIENTYAWLNGQTTGNETDITYNANQQLSGFRSGEWQIQLSRYQPIGDRQLPARIRLMNEALTVTIIVKEYVDAPKL
ncbi:Outer-membrane lipoprotein LolB [BD1-7 clade bacterium]|uniref:Outer-membrane lipoprotein LolB n=1 Tax=BD1-7 clade bacterium TaxID=2029982 RepID=A0A5S9MT49_9GAMM|nr:Outer-membrane lipoprotein LolB [BD1-7 clade bacterium]CAA0084671.1 Outer-membrane lipoprotein LolB [BD1-7 clade bacterium]